MKYLASSQDRICEQCVRPSQRYFPGAVRDGMSLGCEFSHSLVFAEASAAVKLALWL